MFDRSLRPGSRSIADSDWFQMAEETGLLGLLIVLGFAGVIAVSYLRAVRSAGPAVCAAAIGLGFGLLAVAPAELHRFRAAPAGSRALLRRSSAPADQPGTPGVARGRGLRSVNRPALRRRLGGPAAAAGGLEGVIGRVHAPTGRGRFVPLAGWAGGMALLVIGLAWASARRAPWRRPPTTRTRRAASLLILPSGNGRELTANMSSFFPGQSRRRPSAAGCSLRLSPEPIPLAGDQPAHGSRERAAPDEQRGARAHPPDRR